MEKNTYRAYELTTTGRNGTKARFYYNSDTALKNDMQQYKRFKLYALTGKWNGNKFEELTRIRVY